MTTFEKPRLEIAEIFEKFDYLLGPLAPEQRKVIQDIKNCRTKILGGHRLKCNSCEHEKNAYNSCRNRHCPKCQFLAQTKWIEKRMEDLLPCQYFHVVFTVPSELRPLILRNKKVCYDILFKAASQTLKEVAANADHLGAEIGCIGVLHTWGQNLLDHPHIHFIVPGGGLSKDKTTWVPCKPDFLLPLKILSKVFRGKVLEFLDVAFNKNKLKLLGQIAPLSSPPIFKDLLIDCAVKEFVVYAKESFAGPEAVIKYLGQYTHRMAISNYRLVKLEDEKVHFRIRDPENPGKKKVLALPVVEFMRRFLLHVLPRQYMRIRHFGMLGSRLKKMKISIVRQLQGVKEKVTQTADQCWKALLKKTTGIVADLCPHCKTGSLQIVARLWPLINSS